MDCIQHVDTDSDGCQPDFYQGAKRVARKKHRCTECQRMISPGEVYLNETGMWDGTIQTYKTCEDCRSIRASFFGAGFFYGQIRNDLAEHLMEMRGEIGEVHIVCLTPKARVDVCDAIERSWIALDERKRWNDSRLGRCL